MVVFAWHQGFHFEWATNQLCIHMRGLNFEVKVQKTPNYWNRLCLPLNNSVSYPEKGKKMQIADHKNN